MLLFVCLYLLLATGVSAQSNSDTAYPEVDTTYSESYEQTTPEITAVEDVENQSSVPDTATLRSVPDSVISDLRKQKAFEYANDPEYWLKDPPSENNGGVPGFLDWVFSSRGVRMLFYVIIGTILVFAVYRIIVNNSLFYRSSKTISTTAVGEEEDIEDENLEAKLQQAITDKDYRKATRYIYFNLLRKLDTKGWIRYHSQATNQDYLAQVSQYSIAGDFRFHTQVYEYVWYGGFELNENQFAIVNNNYSKMTKVIGV
ncbi:MAG: DUF4129 domain-containing protein [Chitinophagaceae bacterium]|nr:DUF4129 domain-containing protein [Chitinophagaceae bacterium]